MTRTAYAVILTAAMVATSGAAYGEDAAGSCCRTFASIRFAPLEPGTKTLPLDAESPIFAFESGRSHFAAFALPEAKALRLRIESRLFQDPAQGAALFFPRILLLDRSKAVLATVIGADENLLHPGQDAGTGYIDTVVELSQYPAARFMIIYTDAALTGAAEKLQQLVPESAVANPVTGVGSHVFYVEVPDPHLDPSITAFRSPIAPGSLSLEMRAP
jgi:hypothetical protein